VAAAVVDPAAVAAAVVVEDGKRLKDKCLGVVLE